MEAQTITAADQEEDRRAPRRRSRRRLAGSYLLTVLSLVTLNFFLPRSLPGDPLDAFDNPASTDFVRDERSREALTRYYGLDDPLLVQFGHYLSGLARGDLGTSIRYNRPVASVIAERLPWSVLLMTTSILLAALVGGVAGVHSAWRRGRRVDRGLLTLFLGISNVPVFFVGSLVLWFLAVQLQWFPLAGARTPFSTMGPVQRAGDIAYHLVLPASVLALQFASVQYLTMRSSMVSELGADYLVLGRAKGLSERRLKYRYAARNAVLPLVSVVGLEAALAVGGAIFIERIFAYPGMGLLVFESIAMRDYPLLQGAFVVLSLCVVGANFLADLAYRRLDPRTVG